MSKTELAAEYENWMDSNSSPITDNELTQMAEHYENEIEVGTLVLN